MQARLEHIGLNADLAFGCHNAARRHFCAEIAPLFDCNLARANVDQNAAQDDQEQGERDHSANEEKDQTHAISVVHSYPLLLAKGQKLSYSLDARRAAAASSRRTLTSIRFKIKPAPERFASEASIQY